MSSSSEKAGFRASLGSVALLASFVIVALQVIAGASASAPASLAALVLAIAGVGMRVEAAVERRADGTAASDIETDSTLE